MDNRRDKTVCYRLLPHLFEQEKGLEADIELLFFLVLNARTVHCTNNRFQQNELHATLAGSRSVCPCVSVVCYHIDGITINSIAVYGIIHELYYLWLPDFQRHCSSLRYNNDTDKLHTERWASFV